MTYNESLTVTISNRKGRALFVDLSFLPYPKDCVPNPCTEQDYLREDTDTKGAPWFVRWSI